ncbi:peptidogalycan biosysnthesis protein [Streptomyces phyllanthi]|uniref:GNAT family N-acetyltransferase n=1 Tax=Streptomyces phyllanthi TaxID=1803180 RepID=A0A5N8VTM9_9ACTN|nr:GNAT family N-acetyltransferase [Streptomyces phyllanthi]MPY38593.1 GNAT family N-acetyltransferase [Streptomyces phyllanthi]
MLSLGDVADAEWDAVAAAGGLYASHAWLSSIEAEPGARAGYLLARREGRLAGALPWYEVDLEYNPFYALSRHLDILGLDGAWTMAGARRGYRFELPGALSPDAAAVTDVLVDAALEEAARRGERGLLFPFVTTSTAKLLWERGAVVALDGAESSILTGGAPFDDYLATLPSKRRIAARHEYSTFLKAGYELGVEKLADCCEEAAPLLGQLQRKYGHDAHDEGMLQYLAGQLEVLGRYSIVFTARRAGKLIGFSLMYEFGDVLYARAVGFDYALMGKAFEYYALCYYVPIEYMHQKGLRELHLGMETYRAKVARGAVLSPLWSVALPGGPSPRPTVPPSDTSKWRLEYGPRAVTAEQWQPPWAVDWDTHGTAGDRNEGAR